MTFGIGIAPQPGQPAASDVNEQVAMARVIRSESGSYTEPERYAIGWLTRNRAAYARKSIVALVCTPTCGHGGGGRWASTAQPATAADMATAARVLAATPADDPTHGAIDAFEPALQDRMAADGRLTETAAQIRATWGRSMMVYGTIGHWEFYGLKSRRGIPVAATPPAVRRTRKAFATILLSTAGTIALGWTVSLWIGRRS